MVRHKSFRTADELKSFCAREAPLGVYYSTALYKDPENRDMEAKGWLGADLAFDIDGDHLDTPNCRGMELITFGCLEDAKEEAVRLSDVLREELGLNGEAIYSGHRGFHVHVRSAEVRGLSAAERRKLVDFLLARNLDLSIFEKRINKKYIKLYEEEPVGSLVRIMKGLQDSNYSIHIDEVVTADVHRLIRLPGSLNNKTGFIALPIPKSFLEKEINYILDKAIVFKKGNINIKLKKPVKEVLGERINRGDGEEVVVPAYVGVYLYLQGYAELERRRERGEAKK
ncbi:MAG: DNA primase catalytic subunit PriS [Thermoproteus sp.]|nr:DNA primase catalytic subunit PriS [Thermoproteus sp.]